MWLRKRNRRRTAESAAGLPRLSWLQRFSPPQYGRALAVAGAVIGVVGVLWGFGLMLDRPVRRIEVAGKFHRVSPVQIEQVVGPFAASGFISVDLEAVKAALRTIPWVDHARVERSWPNGLRVFVTEQVAAARWGETGLLNVRGELFLPQARYMPPELPRLDGPEGTESQVAKLYLDTYPRLLAVGLRLGSVALDPRGAWEFVLSNGVRVRLGRQDVEQRLERFINVASPLIATRAAEVAYVDMRYSNGFAVGWSKRVATTDRVRKSQRNG